MAWDLLLAMETCSSFCFTPGHGCQTLGQNSVSVGFASGHLSAEKPEHCWVLAAHSLCLWFTTIHWNFKKCLSKNALETMPPAALTLLCWLWTGVWFMTQHYITFYERKILGLGPAGESWGTPSQGISGWILKLYLSSEDSHRQGK